MPLDAVFLSALTRELAPLVEGSRVDKIRMPERDTVLLGLRTEKGTRTLLLCAGSGDARLHFTEAAYDNPAQPPMFCMLLRKHLTGAQITSMEQLPGERAVSLRLRCYDPFQGETERTLVLELMGRYANLIFIDGDGLITDCLKRVDLTESEKRQLLPGLRYEMPPPQEDRVPFHTLCMDGGPSLPEDGGGTPADRWLIRNLSGVCPLMCREIAFSAFGQTDVPVTAETAGTLAQAACAASAAAGGEKEGPWMILRPDGAPMDFYCYPVRQYGTAAELRRESSFSGLLEQYYTARSAAERMRQKAAGLTKTVRNARDRTERKIGLQRAELLKTRDREELRRNGDIISANLYRMKRGDRVLSAEDFYDPESRIREIPLDPAKSPQQNAAAYYKRYSKAKNAETALTEQLAVAERELTWLNSVLEELGRAEREKDLAEIRRELIQTGYVREDRRTEKKRKKEPAEGFLRFHSSSGMEIRVGKNNLQNDELTLRRSSGRDVWLHTQKIHGSHVVISCGGGEPDEQTLTEAAILAALYSDASGSSRVPVDCTLVKNVKKPAGARPGMVIYTDQRTLYVTPDKELAERLKA
ncbi:MAG: NFACT family protein [Oscillospiraceae bacterium]|nr:NFACT family protein [Oscillospiraceae bacterium]